MKHGAIGAIVGLLLGLLVGTALVGPQGAVVGGILGAILGLVIVTPVTVALVVEAAERPFLVNCPEIRQSVRVTLDPKQAGRDRLWNRPQRIATCSRFSGRPTCDQECLGQIDL